jgi:hypothetical protein
MILFRRLLDATALTERGMLLFFGSECQFNELVIL